MLTRAHYAQERALKSIPLVTPFPFCGVLIAESTVTVVNFAVCGASAGTSTPPGISATAVPSIAAPIGVNGFSALPPQSNGQPTTEPIYTNGIHPYPGELLQGSLHSVNSGKCWWNKTRMLQISQLCFILCKSCWVCFLATVCGSAYKRVRTLQHHLQTQLNKEEPSYYCDCHLFLKSRLISDFLQFLSTTSMKSV